MMELVRLPETSVEFVWPEIEDAIEEACLRSNGRYEAQHVKDFVERGIWQLWLVLDDAKRIVFVGATEILIYPTELKTIAWRMGTGDGMDDWLHFMAPILEMAKDECGCSRGEGSFRTGWTRVLKNSGWRHTHSILEKDL